MHKMHFFSLDQWLEGVKPEFSIPEAYDKFPVMAAPTYQKSIFYGSEQGEEDETACTETK